MARCATRTGPEPLYQTIAEILREKIEAGEYPAGTLVPPESQLTREYGASRNTIREAIRWLKDLGLVETQPGRGSTVAERPKLFEITLTPDISRHQQRYIDETPWSLQTSYYPFDFVASGAGRLLMAEDIEEGTVKYLEDALGIKQASYVDRITVRVPATNEIAFFGLPANGSVPVFQTYRTACDTDGKPFRLTISVFPADRTEFLLNVDLPPDA